MSFLQNEEEVDDVFQSTPVKKMKKGGAQRETGSGGVEDSLSRLDFLQDHVFDVEEPGAGRCEGQEQRTAEVVSDQYLNRVINQVRPKHKGEAKALREHQQKSALAVMMRQKAAAASPVVKMKELGRGLTVEGKVKGGRVEVKVRRDFDDDEEEDWEFDEDEEDEADVITGVRV